MKIGDIVLAQAGWSDGDDMGIITGFIYEGELAEMVQVYFPTINTKDYVPVGMVKVIA